MLGTLKPRFREYKWAYHLKKDDDVLDKKIFKYSIVSEQRKSFSKPIRNLVSNRNSFVIQTSYDLDISVGDYIFTDEKLNDKFTVSNYIYVQNKVNEASLGLTKVNNNKLLVMELL